MVDPFPGLIPKFRQPLGMRLPLLSGFVVELANYSTYQE